MIEKSNQEGNITPEDLEKGRSAFLERLKGKAEEGEIKGIRSAAVRLLNHYQSNPKHLDAEVEAQLRINRSDLLGN